MLFNNSLGKFQISLTGKKSLYFSFVNMKNSLMIFYCLVLISCAGNSQTSESIDNKRTEAEIIDQYLKNGAWNYHYLTKEWDQWIDKGLQADSTIAYLWQQKALPFWKQKKYQLAIKYYQHAIKLDPEKWLSRLAFLECIFAKDYEKALLDCKNYIKEFGSTYEQDHPLEIYMGLCYLQLNQYEKAFATIQKEIAQQEKQNGSSWIHFLDRFYLAISLYELGEYEKAVLEFDKVLKVYPKFSDVQYYKAICLNYLGKKEMAQILMKEGKKNFELGYTISEDSSIYEDYPYQVTWQWAYTDSIMK